jgi:hypothetical protein
MSQPDTTVQWDHYERYTSAYGSVTRESNESEWTVLVNRKGEKQAKIKETFTSANVAMAALVRTWKRENGPIVERPVVAKLVKTRTFNDRIRLVAETIAPDSMVGQVLEIIVKGGDSQIQALYDLCRQMQTESTKESAKKEGKG